MSGEPPVVVRSRAAGWAWTDCCRCGSCLRGPSLCPQLQERGYVRRLEDTRPLQSAPSFLSPCPSWKGWSLSLEGSRAQGDTQLPAQQPAKQRLPVQILQRLEAGSRSIQGPDPHPPLAHIHPSHHPSPYT